jgi:small subunit ribosomal protein S4e
VPLLILVRDWLRLVDNAREARSIIKAGKVWVDGRPRKDPKYPAGLFDVVTVPTLKGCWRLTPARWGLELTKIPKREAELKLCRIEGKSWTEGKLQLNLHDGRNLLVKRDVYRTGDSLLLRIPKCQIVHHIKLKGGNVGLVIGGKNRGRLVRIREVIGGRISEPPRVVCEVEKTHLEVPKDYVFVVGRTRPLIKIG